MKRCKDCGAEGDKLRHSQKNAQGWCYHTNLTWDPLRRLHGQPEHRTFRIS